MDANKQKATELKEKGNEALSKGDNQAAIDFYTQAIALDPTNHILYSNRSAAYTKLGKYQEAIQDADKCIELNAHFAKGYSRKGVALCFLGEYEKAKEAYQQGLEQIPKDESLVQGLRDVMAAAKQSQEAELGAVFGQMFQGDIWGKLRMDPNTRPLLDDPSFVSLLNSIQQNPALIAQHLRDPRIAACMGVLLGVKRPPKEGPPEGTETGVWTKPEKMEDDKKKEEPKKEEPKKEEPKKEEPKKEEETKTPEQKEAALEKEKGNEEYKKKNFSAAIEHYTRAKQLDPDNMVYDTNIGAAYFEMGKYDECIEACKQGIETGRRVFADYKLLSRAFTRIGNAYVKQKKYAEAIDAYNSALTEWRNPETLNLLRKAEKLKEQQDAENYRNPEIAEQEKEKGNEAFKRDQIPEAIAHYTEAIKRNPDNPVYYSNRAACYTKLGEYPLGIKDCDKCIELDPKFIKAYLRKGGMQFRMKQYHKCLETYEQGLKQDPANAELQEALQQTLAAINQQQSQGVDEQAVKQAMQDPEIQEILKDPMMQQILSDMQRDPRSASAFLKDPEIAKKVNKLVAAGILQIR